MLLHKTKSNREDFNFVL